MGWLNKNFQSPLEKFLSAHGIEYTRTERGLIIDGNLNLANENLAYLPDLSAVVVSGEFDCSHNQLTSLRGAPRRVGGDFICHNNKLRKLEGISDEVQGDIDLRDNPVYSLYGLPQNWRRLRTDLGTFDRLEDIPAKLLEKEGILASLTPTEKSTVALRKIDAIAPVSFKAKKERAAQAPKTIKRITFKPQRKTP